MKRPHDINNTNFTIDCIKYLIDYIEEGDIKSVESILQIMSDPDKKQQMIQIAAPKALEHNQIKIFEILLKQMSDEESKSQMVQDNLIDAIENDHLEMSELLLNQIIDQDLKREIVLESLTEIIKKNNINMSRLLLIYLDDEEKYDIIKNAIEENISNNYLDMLKLLLEAISNKDKKDDIIKEYFCTFPSQYFDAEILKLLLEHASSAMKSKYIDIITKKIVIQKHSKTFLEYLLISMYDQKERNLVISFWLSEAIKLADTEALNHLWQIMSVEDKKQNIKNSLIDSIKWNSNATFLLLLSHIKDQENKEQIIFELFVEAAKLGSLQVLKLLLNLLPDIAENNIIFKALEEAAIYNTVITLELLLDKITNVEINGQKISDIFIKVTRHTHIKVLEILLHKISNQDMRFNVIALAVKKAINNEPPLLEWLLDQLPSQKDQWILIAKEDLLIPIARLVARGNIQLLKYYKYAIPDEEYNAVIIEQLNKVDRYMAEIHYTQEDIKICARLKFIRQYLYLINRPHFNFDYKTQLEIRREFYDYISGVSFITETASIEKQKFLVNFMNHLKKNSQSLPEIVLLSIALTLLYPQNECNKESYNRLANLHIFNPGEGRRLLILREILPLISWLYSCYSKRTSSNNMIETLPVDVVNKILSYVFEDNPIFISISINYELLLCSTIVYKEIMFNVVNMPTPTQEVSPRIFMNMLEKTYQRYYISNDKKLSSITSHDIPRQI